MKSSLIPTSVSAPEARPPWHPPRSPAGDSGNQADERSPEAAAERAGGSQVNGLMQFNLALLVLDSDYGIFEIKQVFALQLPQLKTNLFRL